jgi:hypothetical protein
MISRLKIGRLNPIGAPERQIDNNMSAPGFMAGQIFTWNK